jgi:hypothetical protein
VDHVLDPMQRVPPVVALGEQSEVWELRTEGFGHRAVAVRGLSVTGGAEVGEEHLAVGVIDLLPAHRPDQSRLLVLGGRLLRRRSESSEEQCDGDPGADGGEFHDRAPLLTRNRGLLGV